MVLIPVIEEEVEVEVGEEYLRELHLEHETNCLRL